MGENFQFGGGLAQTSMTPAVLAATLLAAVLVLVLPRKYALAPILVVAFLSPAGQQIFAAGFHFYVIRIVILAGGLRVLHAKFSTKNPLFEGGLNRLDTLFCLWASFRVLTFILLYRESSAVTNQVGFCLDAYGGYFLFRYLLQSQDDVSRAGKALAVVITISAACMGYEYLTGVNAFNALRGWVLAPWIREGKVRAQGVFGNSITAGSFGATLLPLFFWLWKSGRAKAWGATGLVASTTVVLASVAGTPTLTFVATLGALCLWPIRARMRSVRWGILLVVLALALVMKAPVWFVIARLDVIGGAHAWDRAALIDQFVRHTSDWWLLGTKANASWGTDTWDACNQFVAEGTGGGLISLILFVLILSRGFGVVGKARKQVAGDRRQEWFFWCLGVLLFSHLITFWGVDYFDQIRIWWFVTLAMVSAATAASDANARPKLIDAPVSDVWFSMPSSYPRQPTLR